MLAPEAGRVWARVPRSAAVRSFAPRLRPGVLSVASGDGGPGDSFEDLETSRIARIPRGLRVTVDSVPSSPAILSHTLVPTAQRAGGPWGA